MNRATDPLYPGRKLPDEQRTAFGLGWEYARRGWSPDICPLKDSSDICDFLDGYTHFVCNDPKVSAAMIGRGVPVLMPAG